MKLTREWGLGSRSRVKITGLIYPEGVAYSEGRHECKPAIGNAQRASLFGGRWVGIICPRQDEEGERVYSCR